MFLSQEDLQELTGYKVYSKQISWLLRNGIKFLVSSDGSPKILISHINEILGLNMKPTKRKAEPNVEALKSYMGL